MATDGRWLLLTYQLPSRPSNARVQTWRRLQEIGAVAAGTSAYVLPDIEKCRRDVQALRRDIVARGGEAIVFAGGTDEAGESRRLVATFRRLREADYRSLSAGIRRRQRQLRKPGPAGRRAVDNLRARFNAIVGIDFFEAPGRGAAGASIDALERWLERRSRNLREDDPATRRAAEFQNRRWVTRPRPGIDRLASAWLIRRFIDPFASFAFVSEAGPDDVPFDIPDTGFTHQGGMCTFETLADAFAIRNDGVRRLGRVVHDLDLKDGRSGAPEVAAIGRVVDGLRALYADDHVLLEYGISFFDAYADSRETQRKR
jgi:hypothetical protein